MMDTEEVDPAAAMGQLIEDRNQPSSTGAGEKGDGAKIDAYQSIINHRDGAGFSGQDRAALVVEIALDGKHQPCT